MYVLYLQYFRTLLKIRKMLNYNDCTDFTGYEIHCYSRMFSLSIKICNQSSDGFAPALDSWAYRRWRREGIHWACPTFEDRWLRRLHEQSSSNLCLKHELNWMSLTHHSHLQWLNRPLTEQVQCQTLTLLASCSVTINYLHLDFSKSFISCWNLSETWKILNEG